MSDENAPKMICPFCDAPFNADMQVAIDRISEGCPSCGHGEAADGRVVIYCSECGKKVYEKEFRETPW